MAPLKPRKKSVLITCKIPSEIVDVIDRMVGDGLFSSRSEAIRYAIGSLISSSSLLKGKAIEGEEAA